MRYTFLSAHCVQGIAHPVGQPDLTLFDDPAIGVCVVLTADIVSRLHLLNRHLALMHMVLTGKISDPLPDDFATSLVAETEEVERLRRDSIGSDAGVIVQISGEVDAVIPGHARAVLDFILCFDAYDKKALSTGFTSKVSAVLSALRTGTGDPLEFRPIGEGSYLVANDGRIVHSASFEAGAVGAYVSRFLTGKQQEQVAIDIGLALKAGPLERVMRLHALSLKKATDSYRAFVSAWSALEILISKLFLTYQGYLVGEMRAVNQSPGLHAYLDRIEKVMADKYSLADKFAVLSVYLDDVQDENDVQTFRDLKKVRDKLFHGEEVDENALPTNGVQRLFDKYLRNHLRRDAQQSAFIPGVTKPAQGEELVRGR